MRPLILGPAELAAAAAVRRHAERFPTPLETLVALTGNRPAVVMDDERNCMVFPVGIGVCFTVEHQRQGLIRHLSIRIQGDDPTKAIHPDAAEEIMPLFGMTALANCVAIWRDEVDNSIHLAEPLVLTAAEDIAVVEEIERSDGTFIGGLVDDLWDNRPPAPKPEGGGA